MFKIEGEGGGLSYLKRTTDSEFPRTFDVIPNLLDDKKLPEYIAGLVLHV